MVESKRAGLQRNNQKLSSKFFSQTPPQSKLTIMPGLVLFVLLMCTVISPVFPVQAPCQDFQAILGVDLDDVDVAVKLSSTGYWNTSVCPQVHPMSVMIIPYTVAIGHAMCDMFDNSFPWAGISYENSTWVWVDNVDRPVTWTAGKADIPHNVSNGYVWGMSKCGEIHCSDGYKGTLYNDLCIKFQDIICQVNCKETVLEDGIFSNVVLNSLRL
jgi:hypothetical protein